MSEKLSPSQVWRFHSGDSEIGPRVKQAAAGKYTIYSWTIVPGPPNEELPEFSMTPIRLAEGFIEQAPIAFAYIQTPEGNLILSQITDLLPKEIIDTIKIGMEVEPVVKVLRNDGTGPILYGTKFRPPLAVLQSD